MSDPWSVLGVSKDATAEQVRHAYITRAQLFHPDRHQDGSPAALAEAERAMAALNEAWQTIQRTQAKGAAPPTRKQSPQESRSNSIAASERTLYAMKNVAMNYVVLAKATVQLRGATVKILAASFSEQKFSEMTNKLTDTLHTARSQCVEAEKAKAKQLELGDPVGMKATLLLQADLMIRAAQAAIDVHQYNLLGLPLNYKLRRLESVVAMKSGKP